MAYEFHTCDVFSETRFGGNPLAVFPNAKGLTSEQMQSIARELNLSETTFVLPGSGEFTRQVRIFTPAQEVPFAGHPNVGTAFTLAKLGEFGQIDDQTKIVFDEKAGPVPITIRKDESKIWCELKAPTELTIGETIPVPQIAAAIGLQADQIVTSTHPPQVASVGLGFITVELLDRDALANATVLFPIFEEIQKSGVHPYVFMYVRSNDEFDIRARMFAPTDNIMEDPATGSATCAMVALLTHCNPESDGEYSFRVGQGIEMGRPSLLEARTKKEDGVVTGVWVGGTCVTMTSGSIEL
jgi:trans-2,3-dihydro-3-hydroxyanthranilate isomerase